MLDLFNYLPLGVQKLVKFHEKMSALQFHSYKDMMEDDTFTS